MIKRCGKCLKEKDISSFCKNKHSSDGLEYICRECHSILNAEYRRKNSENLKQKRKIFREENREELSRHAKELRLANPEKYRKKESERRNKNIEKSRLYDRELYQRNKKKTKERNRLWKRMKYQNDLSFRTQVILRNRLRSFINDTIPNKTCDLIGCSKEELIVYLESQFQPGMNWDNYGKTGWHIDHIQPCVSFDLSDPEQQKKCFHYTNLQPLWAVDNYIKGIKIVDML